MIKHILVPTDGSDAAVVAVRYAAAFAGQYEARIHGLHVIDIKLLEGPFLRDVSASLGTAPYVNYQGNINMILEERGKMALDTVREICETAGVACDTELVTGLVPRVILERSELTDLIVMGRGGEHMPWLEGLLGTTTQAIVRRAHRPVLITAEEEPRGGLFLVAYDGSSYARHALQAAAELAWAWKARVVLLTVGEAHAQERIQEARDYLSPHEIEVDYQTAAGDPSETIVECARDLQPSLLIMGAYGHTKVRELVVGSTTAYVMNHAPCPLFLTR
jgi:nucleotide-binding universal stress UspA family protein